MQYCNTYFSCAEELKESWIWPASGTLTLYKLVGQLAGTQVPAQVATHHVGPAQVDPGGEHVVPEHVTAPLQVWTIHVGPGSTQVWTQVGTPDLVGRQLPQNVV